LDYLRTWGETWYFNAPAHLLNDYVHGRARQPDEEVVVISKVLPAEINAGYEDFVNRRIVAVNHQPVKNLRELVALVEQPADSAFIVLTTAQNEQLVFERSQAARYHPQILATYEIARDRSEAFSPHRFEVFSQLP
jgi:hypothetical protein